MENKREEKANTLISAKIKILRDTSAIISRLLVCQKKNARKKTLCLPPFILLVKNKVKAFMTYMLFLFSYSNFLYMYM
jgi:hypothetical protein